MCVINISLRVRVKYTFLREKAILPDKPNGCTTYFNKPDIYILLNRISRNSIEISLADEYVKSSSIRGYKNLDD